MLPLRQRSTNEVHRGPRGDAQQFRGINDRRGGRGGVGAAGSKSFHHHAPLTKPSTAGWDVSLRCNSPTPSLLDLAKAEVDDLVLRLQPTAEAHARRQRVVEDVASIIYGNSPSNEESGDILVLISGSFASKTYLPDSDVDLVIFPHSSDSGAHPKVAPGSRHRRACSPQRSLGTPLQEVCAALTGAAADGQFAIRNVSYVAARTPLVSLVVGNVSVDVTVDQLGSVAAAALLEKLNADIGPPGSNLLKRSLLLLKAWGKYEFPNCVESGGAFCFTTYALLVLVVRLFHVELPHGCPPLDHPLSVLVAFAIVYGEADWFGQCMTLDGSVPTAKVAEEGRVGSPPLVRDLELTCSGESRGFQLRSANIADPLDSSNNLGYSVRRKGLTDVVHALRLLGLRLTEFLQLRKPDHGVMGVPLAAGAMWTGLGLHHSHMLMMSPVSVPMNLHAQKQLAHLHQPQQQPPKPPLQPPSQLQSSYPPQHSPTTASLSSVSSDDPPPLLSSPGSTALAIDGFLGRFFPRSIQLYGHADGFRADLMSHPCQPWSSSVPWSPMSDKEASESLSADLKELKCATDRARRLLAARACQEPEVEIPASKTAWTQCSLPTPPLLVDAGVMTARITTSDVGLQVCDDAEGRRQEAPPAANARTKKQQRRKAAKDAERLAVQQNGVKVSASKPLAEVVAVSRVLLGALILAFISLCALLLLQLRAHVDSPHAAGATLYEASASNSLGREAASTASLLLPASELPLLLPEHGTMMQMPHWVPEGSSVTLGGFSPSAVHSVGIAFQWVRNGSPIEGATFSHYAIPSAKLEDAGKYDCIAFDADGEGTLWASTNLRIVVPPSLSTPLPDPREEILLDTGDTLELSVHASAFPPAEYVWQRNGRTLFAHTGPDLEIRGVTFADMGVYSCIVQNLGGSTVWGEARVVVRPALA
jgi:hypothetical protein